MRPIKFRSWFDGSMVNDMIPGELVGDAWEGEIMQFTGLLDKNKKEIYESDIVEYFDSYSERKTGVVEWKDNGSWYIPGRAYPVDYPISVIGNVYETPDKLS